MRQLVENVLTAKVRIVRLGLFKRLLESVLAQCLADGFEQVCHAFAVLG